MEDEPEMRLTLATGGEILGNRDNTYLYRYFGKLALYDHIFFLTNPEDNEGIYLFSAHPVFEEIAEYMITNDFPAFLNLRQVPQCDLDAYDKMISQDAANDLESGVPEGWC